jgi:hypothetical protein
MCQFSILPQVAILERLGPIAAVKRCWKMTSGAFWRLGMVLTMLTVVNYVLTEAISEPLQMLQEYAVAHTLPILSSLSADENLIIDSIIKCFVGLLVAPFGIAVMTIAYYDIRIRDEGFDMAILTEILGHGNADQHVWVPEKRAVGAIRAAKKR